MALLQKVPKRWIIKQDFDLSSTTQDQILQQLFSDITTTWRSCSRDESTPQELSYSMFACAVIRRTHRYYVFVFYRWQEREHSTLTEPLQLECDHTFYYGEWS